MTFEGTQNLMIKTNLFRGVALSAMVAMSAGTLALTASAPAHAQASAPQVSENTYIPRKVKH